MVPRARLSPLRFRPDTSRLSKDSSLSLDFLGVGWGVGDDRTTASLCANHPFSFKEGGGHVERPRDSGAFPGEVPSRAQEGTRAAFLSGDPVDKCSATVSASLLPSTSRTGRNPEWVAGWGPVLQPGFPGKAPQRDTARQSGWRQGARGLCGSLTPRPLLRGNVDCVTV